MSAGDEAVIFVKARCLPEAWEKCVLAVWDKGFDVKTEYDRPGNPPSKDATVMVTVTEPFAEPRIHKNFPGGPAELEMYRREVVGGIHDHWIDPASGKWTYTYHERLRAYCPVEDLQDGNASRPFARVDQIEYIIDCLSKVTHSRRAQAVTWMPTADPKTDDPPCLQRVWCRLVEGNDGRLSLCMNTHWRSRDLYRAWFMNAYAFTDLQRIIAESISQNTGRAVAVGRYVDISDSLHIYGSSFADASKEIEKMRATPFTERAWESTHPAFEMITQEAASNLDKDPDCYSRSKS